MNQTWDRDALLRRLETILDTALQQEDAPLSIPEELLSEPAGNATTAGSMDAYGLWSAMTQLVQEVKLQGRAFQELNLSLNTQSAKLTDEAVRQAQRDTERRCRKETLRILLDLHDRMEPGLNAVHQARAQAQAQPPPNWLARLLHPSEASSASREVLAAIVQGYELSMERIAAALAEMDAHEIRCTGEPFDPRRMNAIDTQETGDVAEGTVLEVYRRGFEWRGELLRPAQVKVARAPQLQDLPATPENSR
ncbi:MAG: nucleotide exchange factor GrpE [Acidobacteria bacterium]|nr:nucleotide exchange factor GrpE [Acidobacteriota bacterium]